MNPKLKLFFLIMTSILVLWFSNIANIWLLMGIVTILIYSFRLTGLFIPWLKPILYIMVFIILIQSVTFANLVFSFEGLLFGIFFSLRLAFKSLAYFIPISVNGESLFPWNWFDRFHFIWPCLAMKIVVWISFMLFLNITLSSVGGRERALLITCRNAKGANWNSPAPLPIHCNDLVLHVILICLSSSQDRDANA